MTRSWLMPLARTAPYCDSMSNRNTTVHTQQSQSRCRQACHRQSFPLCERRCTAVAAVRAARQSIISAAA